MEAVLRTLDVVVGRSSLDTSSTPPRPYRSDPDTLLPPGEGRRAQPSRGATASGVGRVVPSLYCTPRLQHHETAPQRLDYTLKVHHDRPAPHLPSPVMPPLP